MHEKLYHMHIIVRVEANNSTALSTEELKDWVRHVIETQHMEIVQGPFVTRVEDAGNVGPTGGAHIKTSHFAFHIWEETGLIQADLYTCGALDVEEFIKAFQVFEPSKIDYVILDREYKIKFIEGGTV